MIKPITMYTAICDNCGRDVHTESEYSCVSEEWHLNEIMSDSDWETIDGKHYCFNCWGTNDDDEIVVIPKIESK